MTEEESRDCYSLGLLFNPEEGFSTFLRNNGELLLAYMLSYARKQNSSCLVFLSLMEYGLVYEVFSVLLINFLLFVCIFCDWYLIIFL